MKTGPSSIDLNADMGEYADQEQALIERDLMALVTSCSIACGGHAGDEASMRATIRSAQAAGVAIGAHPSYPDRAGFGRRAMTIDADALRQSICEQINTLREIAREENMRLQHVKPHGALYNEAARNEALAALIAEEAGEAILVGPSGSALERAAAKRGGAFAAEGFVDRLYQRDGALTARGADGAIIGDHGARARQGVAIATGATFPCAGGTLLINAATLCIHSDSPGAIETAKALRDALEASGVAISAFGRQP